MHIVYDLLFYVKCVPGDLTFFQMKVAIISKVLKKNKISNKSSNCYQACNMFHHCQF